MGQKLMRTKTAFKYSLTVFFLLCLFLWVSKLLDYPVPIEVMYDQDAVINGVWRILGVAVSFVFSFFVFMMFVLILSFKKK